MVQTPSKPLTIEEFLQLPETQPASEFIDGQILQKPMPKGKHSTLQLDLGAAINGVLKPTKIARAYTELRCTFGSYSIVPDVAVFVWNRIPRDASGEVADTFTISPDWVIEILSPDQNQTRVVKKILSCLKQGTQLGWLIDPEEKSIFVYYPHQTPQAFDEPEQILPVPEFAKDLHLTLQQLFDWLMD